MNRVKLGFLYGLNSEEKVNSMKTSSVDEPTKGGLTR